MFRFHFQAFDTECEIRLPRKLFSCELADECFAFIHDECQRYEGLFSAYLETSDIGRLNNAQGRPTPVAPEAIELVARSLEYCSRYPDVFNICIGAATRLWDFHTGRNQKPSHHRAQQMRKHTDYRGVRVDLGAGTITLEDPESRLDLGACAKGYIADKICASLIARGAQSGILDFGGAITLMGEDPDGRPWLGSIADPRSEFDPKEAPLVRIQGRDLSIATSSIVLRSFEDGDELLHHVLDPKTGMPRRTDLLSASIISASAFRADCLSTIALALGMEGAKKLISREGVEGVLVQSSGDIYLSSRLRSESSSGKRS